MRDGKPVFRSLEGFTTDQLAYRHPRTGVGQTADGRILLVAVDGRQPGYSTGLTNFELALTMMRLGCVTASALDAGGSTTMAFDGKLLNRPSDPGGERAVAEALTLFYYGVYAPALPARVLSPNADGVDDAQTFAYKLVRPSTVTATLTRSRRRRRAPRLRLERAPGIYKFNWTGAGQPEGAWTFRTIADDDLGRHSTADRQFGLNNTLGFLAASASHRRVTGSFKLARPGARRAAHRDARRRHRQDPRDAKLPGRRRDDLLAGASRQLRLQRHRDERGRGGRAHRPFRLRR